MIIFRSISYQNFLSTGNAANTIVLNKSNNSEINEGFWDSLFGKPTVDDAAHDQMRGQGWSHRGKDEENYIMFQGQKFYPEQIQYDDAYSTKQIPRIEGDMLIVANPAWNL